MATQPSSSAGTFNTMIPKGLSVVQTLISTMYSAPYLHFHLIFLVLMIVGLAVQCCYDRKFSLFVDARLILSKDNSSVSEVDFAPSVLLEVGNIFPDRPPTHPCHSSRGPWRL